MTIPNVVVHHPLTILFARVYMIASAIMGFATPTFWRGGWVVDWQPELAEHGQPKQQVADTIVWLDTIHCNQRKRCVWREDARENMKMISILVMTVVVE